MAGLRLNLGCGARRLDGYLNVDRCGTPDVTHDRGRGLPTSTSAPTVGAIATMEP
jgi:hypothetical protein